MNNNNLEILYTKHKKDFEQALNIYENEYSHEELMQYLKNGSVAEKQAAALKLDKICDKNDADILINNLTGCDGKIREAVSFRLVEFVKENPDLYVNYSDIFLEAIIDINGNICRNTINALKYIKNIPEFNRKFCDELVKRTVNLAKTAKSFDIQDGKYKVNKEIFKLYWYLETVSEFTECIDLTDIAGVVSQSKDVEDYTIREKTAKILSKLNNEDLSEMKKELKRDANYYVRRF